MSSATEAPTCVALCGPAGCGKTQVVVSEYTARVHAEGEDAALWLLPTDLACRRARLGLIEHGQFPALFDPRILTFPDLAELILRANGESVAQITGWQRHLLMRSVARELCETGQLHELAEMCRFPGFIDELCSLVDELKRAAVDPRQFAARVAASSVNDLRSRELAAVYERYQRLLQEREVFDDAGRFWQARDVLMDARRRPFEDLRLILVDGFDDFTTTQLQVLQELARGQGVERVLVTVCREPDVDRRPELFGTPTAMLADLRRIFPDLQEQWMRGGDAGGPMVALGQRLFSEDEAPSDAPPAGVVELIETPGRRAEVAQVALRTKALIRDEGVRPERIGLMARDLSSYRQALLTVFDEAGIPLNLSEAAPLAARPSVQAVLDILRIPMAGCRCADVMRLLKSNFVDLSSLQPPEPIEPDEVERIARAAGIIGGDRAYWGDRLVRYMSKVDRELAARSRDDRDEDEPWLRGRTDELAAERGLIERAQMLLKGVFDALGTLPDNARLADFIEALYALISQLGIEQSVGEAGDISAAAANIRALSALMEALRDSWGADRQLGVSDTMSLAEFGAATIRMAGSQSCQQASRAPDGVLAVPVEDARQLDFDYVFLLGMTERDFPRGQRESSIYSDADRERLCRADIPLEPRLADRHREPFLFYSAVTAAHRRLWLSYPTVDAEGHELLRSHYVEEVERCFSQAVPRSRYDVSQTVADFDSLTGPGALLRRCMLELFGPDVAGERREAQAGAGLELLAQEQSEILQALTWAMQVQDRRESERAPDEYDGALNAPETAARVAADFGPDHLFSTGQLGDYGNCPFAFFASRVLRLEELTDVTEDVDAAVDRRIDEADLPAAGAMMDEVVGHVFSDTLAQQVVGDAAVFEVMRDEVRRDLRLWLEFEVDGPQSRGHSATDLEAAFGYGRVPPLAIGESEAQVLMRGRIDRVDRFVAEDGAPAFAVYDYKSSDGPAPPRITEGLDFQLPAYALAVRDLIAQDPQARCEEWAYYKLRRPIDMSTRPAPDKIQELIEQMQAHALKHAANIRGARFAPMPAKCDYCDFRSLCRWDEWRFARKCAVGGDGDE